MSSNLQQRCINRVEEVFQIAEKHYGRKFSRPEIVFSNLMTKCAGRATYSTEEGSLAHGSREIQKQTFRGTEIRLSNKILEMNPEQFVTDTPGHEAAHIIAVEQYGWEGHGHGPRWAEVMELIGQPANTFHSMKVKKKRLFLYTNGKQLTLIRHNKLQRGKVTYYHWKDGIAVYKEDFIREL